MFARYKKFRETKSKDAPSDNMTGGAENKSSCDDFYDQLVERYIVPSDRPIKEFSEAIPNYMHVLLLLPYEICQGEERILQSISDVIVANEDGYLDIADALAETTFCDLTAKKLNRYQAMLYLCHYASEEGLDEEAILQSRHITDIVEMLGNEASFEENELENKFQAFMLYLHIVVSLLHVGNKFKSILMLMCLMAIMTIMSASTHADFQKIEEKDRLYKVLQPLTKSGYQLFRIFSITTFAGMLNELEFAAMNFVDIFSDLVDMLSIDLKHGKRTSDINNNATRTTDAIRYIARTNEDKNKIEEKAIHMSADTLNSESDDNERTGLLSRPSYVKINRFWTLINYIVRCCSSRIPWFKQNSNIPERPLEPGLYRSIFQKKGNVRIDENDQVVVAIDLGTKYSGYALTVKSCSDEIILNEEWVHGINNYTLKTPSVCLTKQGSPKDLIEYGYEAVRQYTQLSYKTTDDYSLYRLGRNQDNQKPLDEEAFEKLLTTNIQYFYEHLQHYLFGETARDMQPNIYWKLVICLGGNDNTEKRENTIQRLQEVLSPCQLAPTIYIFDEIDASAIWCLHYLTQLSIPLREGAKFNVVNAGGSHIDIATYAKKTSNTLTKCSITTTEYFNIDEGFEQNLRDWFGDRTITKYKASHPNDWEYICSQFEQVKRIYSFDNKTPAVINMPTTFDTYVYSVWSLYGIFIYTADYCNGRLTLTKTVLDDLFKPIKDKFSSFDNEMSGNYLFVVGGFSRILGSYLRTEVEKKKLPMQVIEPPHADVCVLKGCVLYGTNKYSVDSGMWVD